MKRDKNLWLKIVRLEGALGLLLKPVSPKTKTVLTGIHPNNAVYSISHERNGEGDINSDLFDDETDRAAIRRHGVVMMIEMMDNPWPDAVAVSQGRSGNRCDSPGSVDWYSWACGTSPFGPCSESLPFTLGVASAGIEMALAS